MKNILRFISVAWLLCACNDRGTAPSEKGEVLVAIPAIVVDAGDTLLTIRNGAYFYHDTLFCGSIRTNYPSGNFRSIQTFYKGREEGWLSASYENGAPDSHRHYHNGEKDGLSEGWWSNGYRRFEYHFRNGLYYGDFKEWYRSGKPMKHIVYWNGKEIGGRGWRENGKPYMSFMVKDGRYYGLINPNLCYSLRNEKGQFDPPRTPQSGQ